MERRLTGRYLFALGLVAAVLVVTYVLIVQQDRQQRDAGYVINIAGMQRMLSQRIHLLIEQLHVRPGDTDAAIKVYSLGAAIERMQDNHRELTEGAGVAFLTQDIQARYFEQDGVDELTTQFLAAARTAQSKISSNPAGALEVDVELTELERVQSEGLLPKLDAVVSALEQEIAVRVQKSIDLKKTCFIAGLAVLILEALFVFAPMVRMIRETLVLYASANNALREFSYRLSHNLRAPVASAIGLVSITQETMANGDHDMARDSIERLSGAMMRLDKQISDSIAALKSQESLPDPEPVHMQQLFETVIAKLDHLPGFDHVRVSTHVRHEEPVVIVRSYVEQIVENFVSNAIKYQDPNASQSYVDIDYDKQGDLCEIRVRDNGLGVPAAHRGQLFERFQRFHPHAASGSGLGLYLVRRCAEAIGGTVNYKAVTEGSEFSFVFNAS
ncbi:MAG: ATP-binding protein [Pseudomonadota bacterium]